MVYYIKDLIKTFFPWTHLRDTWDKNLYNLEKNIKHRKNFKKS